MLFTIIKETDIDPYPYPKNKKNTNIILALSDQHPIPLHHP